MSKLTKLPAITVDGEVYFCHDPNKTSEEVLDAYLLDHGITKDTVIRQHYVYRIPTTI